MQIEPRCRLLPRCMASLALLSKLVAFRLYRSGKPKKPIEAVSADRRGHWTMQGSANTARDAFGEILGVIRQIPRHLQSEEFIAALPGQELAGPEHGAHPLGHLDQQAVAGAVTRTGR